ncbi:MAG: hypothetical protein QXY15_10480 [Candidatus Nitrosotenuis sp.]
MPKHSDVLHKSAGSFGAHSVSIYVPSNIKGKQLSDDEHLKIARFVAGQLSQLHGGATVTKGHGGWIDNDGNYVEEPVYIVHSKFSPKSHAHLAELILKHHGIADALRTTMNQQSVLVSHRDGSGREHVAFIDGQQLFTTPPKQFHENIVNLTHKHIGQDYLGKLYNENQPGILQKLSQSLHNDQKSRESSIGDKIGEFVERAKSLDYEP